MTAILLRQKTRNALYFDKSDVKALLKYFEDLKIIVAECKKGDNWKYK